MIPVGSFALSNQAREAPSLRPQSPSAPRALPVALTCRSCWCNWYRTLLLQERQNSPVLGGIRGCNSSLQPLLLRDIPQRDTSVRSPKEGQDATTEHQPPRLGAGSSGVGVPTALQPARNPSTPPSPREGGHGRRSWGGVGGGGGGRGRGCGAFSAASESSCNAKTIITPREHPTKVVSSRFCSFRRVRALSPHTRLLSPHKTCVRFGVGFLGFFFVLVVFFFIISVNILNCKCCLVMTIAYCFGRCFFTMHTNILWLLYMNIFNDT